MASKSKPRSRRSKPRSAGTQRAAVSSLPSAPPRVASTAIGLAALSATAAGIHEVAWGRLLTLVTGSSLVGVSLTLAAFMFGMGAGLLLVARVRWPARPAYVVCELVIAAGSLALSFYALEGGLASGWLGLDGGAALAADVLSIALVLAAPAVAMGATYPLLVDLVRDPRSVRSLYAAGLAGVVLGTLLTALVIAPAIGVDGAVWTAVVLNGIVAAVAWFSFRDEPRIDAGAPSRRADLAAAARFASAGAIGIAAQAIWNRALAPYAGVSVFTFAAIVAAYVLFQAVGFAIHARAPKPGFVALALAASGPLALGSLAVIGLFDSELPSRDAAPAEWFLAAGGVVALVVAPVAVALGFAQAGALAMIERDANLRARVSVVVGLGTVGAAAAALLTTLVAIPLVGLRLALALVSIPALAVAAREQRIAAAAGAVSVVALVLAGLGPRWFLGPSFEDKTIYYVDEGVQETTAVVAEDRPVEPRIRRLVSGGLSYSGDSAYAQRYMRLLAHLPALAARGEARALVICIGTGTTADALRAYRYDRIEAVDLSPSITETLAFFSHVNHELASDERVAILVEDGARFVRRTRESYDVITLEPPPPRAPGASSLYSEGFYRAARARLRPGGVLAQWLPLHRMSGAELETLARTFAAVFEHATLHVTERNEAVLLSANAPADPERLARVRESLGDIGFARGDPLVETRALDPGALREVLGRGPIVRDGWPMPEYAPLAGANASVSPADVFVERVADRSTAAADTFASILLPVVPAFLRVERGREETGDRDRVRQAMTEWLARDPSDPYVQHAFGYGPLLERRLQRVASELTPASITELRMLMTEQRTRTAPE
jgi:predicted membrane-bound spermidine synthase